MEDLYVKPECRGKGYGKAILKNWHLSLWNVAADGLNGGVLTGTNPAFDFYLSLGAEAMSDWTVYRIAGDTLTQLAE